MPDDNRISITVSDEEKTAIDTAVNSIQTTLQNKLVSQTDSIVKSQES